MMRAALRRLGVTALPLGIYRGLHQLRGSGRTCLVVQQHWDSVRVSDSNAAPMSDPTWLPPALTSHVGHRTPLVLLETLSLKTPSAHAEGNTSVHVRTAWEAERQMNAGNTAKEMLVSILQPKALLQSTGEQRWGRERL